MSDFPDQPPGAAIRRNHGTKKNRPANLYFARNLKWIYFGAKFKNGNLLNFAILQTGSTYGQMFSRALKYHGQLCVGLYRLHDQVALDTNKRYVITNPPAELRLLNTDFVSLIFLTFILKVIFRLFFYFFFLKHILKVIIHFLGLRPGTIRSGFGI